MVACLALGMLAYHFQALDFIPLDLNDKGWIVGESFEKSAVLLVKGKRVDLGDAARTGSAIAVNNLGHVLIETAAGHPPETKSMSKRGKWGHALSFWAEGKATYLGDFMFSGRLLDNDRFLSRQAEGQKLVRVVDRKAVFASLPSVPSLVGAGKASTVFLAMNERGGFVGSSDRGTDQTHAFVIGPSGTLIDLYPNVEIHTEWTANLINSRGDVLGFHSYDSSVGGGTVFLWRDGKVTDWPSVGNGGLTARAVSLNDSAQAVGNMDLYVSGATSHALQNQELEDPSRASAITHAMLWDKAKLWDLNDLTDAPKDCVLATATRINSRGYVIGTAVRAGRRIGFLLSPGIR